MSYNTLSKLIAVEGIVWNEEDTVETMWFIY